MKQPNEITFETEETVVLREGSKVCIEYCSACDRNVLMATARTAALLSNVSEREIFRLVESNLLHFSENGRVMICLESAQSFGATVNIEVGVPDNRSRVVDELTAVELEALDSLKGAFQEF